MLDKTQGTVNAQLDFSTWKIYSEDPFYTPLTEEVHSGLFLGNRRYGSVECRS